MNKWSILLARSVVVSLVFLKVIHPIPAEAADPLVTSAQSVVQAKFLDPLQKMESNRSRFSRAVLPPQARRVRILDNTPQADREGRLFLSFAVDESRSFGIEKDKGVAEDQWFKNAITGCVYPQTGDVLVKLGEAYYASSVLLGRSTPTSPADVCQTR
jgi:hypothetical protein